MEKIRAAFFHVRADDSPDFLNAIIPRKIDVETCDKN